MDLFKDILPSIFEKTEYLFDGKYDESKYNVFIVNKALSFSLDTSIYASIISRTPNITKKQHYDYLYYSIPRGKRFIKWFKSEKPDNVEYVMKYFQCSEPKAVEILNIITSEDLEQIKITYTGDNDHEGTI
jgi:hypothetical protein